MATIREIADKSGFSLGTVDRVLHNRGRVAPETAERIKAVIEELGFTPNLFARNLSTSREYRLGVLIPQLEQDNDYWKLPWSGIKAEVKSLRAYKISLLQASFDRYDSDSFRQAHRRLVTEGVDGILMAPVVSQDVVREILDQEGLPPHVCFDTAFEHEKVLSSIGQDSLRSGRLAGRLMALLCPQEGQIAALVPDIHNKHIGSRCDGFRTYLEEFRPGLHISWYTRSHRTDVKAFTELLQKILGEHSDIKALLVVDSSTHLAAEALEKLGRSDLPLVGYDFFPADIPSLESGQIAFLITQSPVEQGMMGVRQLFTHLVLNLPVERALSMPINIVTKENFAEHLTHF